MILFLCLTGHVDRAFESEEGSYDYVINCAAETRYGQTDEVRFYIHFFNLFSPPATTSSV